MPTAVINLHGFWHFGADEEKLSERLMWGRSMFDDIFYVGYPGKKTGVRKGSTLR